MTHFSKGIANFVHITHLKQASNLSSSVAVRLTVSNMWWQKANSKTYTKATMQLQVKSQISPSADHSTCRDDRGYALQVKPRM